MNKVIFKRVISICLLLSMLFSNVDGTMFGEPIKAEAAAHPPHTDDCYTGTKHWHDSYNCFNSYWEVCGDLVATSEVIVVLDTHSLCNDCLDNNVLSTYSITYYYVSCDGCGEVLGPSFSEDEPYDYAAYRREPCSNCGQLASWMDSDVHIVGSRYHEIYISSDDATCGKTEGVYYDSNGNECLPVCDKVVTSLEVPPAVAVQTLTAGQIPNASVTAHFLDGHTENVTCSYSGFNPTLYNTAQNVTLSYGEYNGTAKNSGPCTAMISVKVNGYFNLRVTSEDTSKGTVTDINGQVLCNSPVSIQAYASEGHKFDGWFSNGSLVTTSNPYSFNMPAENTVYTARFSILSYELSVEASSSAYGRVSGSGTFEYGSQRTIDAEAADGYSFKGWYDGTRLVSTEERYTFSMPAKDYTLTALFLPAEMLVSFDSGDGTSCAPITVTYNEIYGALPRPVLDGYMFGGWYLDGVPITSSTVVTEKADHTLTARWGTLGPASLIYVYDKYYDPLPDPDDYGGYLFDGWYMSEYNDNGTGTQIRTTDIVKITSDRTFYAKWDTVEPTVHFDANGGTVSPTSMRVKYGERYDHFRRLPDSRDVQPPNSDVIFGGWYFSVNGNEGIGSSVVNSAIVDIVTDVTLYASWIPADEATSGGIPVTVTLDPGIGTVNPTSVVVTYVGTYGALPNPKPPLGFVFTGWYADDGTRVTGSTSVICANDHTLTADYAPTAYVTLTVKGLVNGTLVSDLTEFVTFDVYVGNDFYDDISVFSVGNFVSGTTYSISDIREIPGYTYVGLSQSSDPLVGTLSVLPNGSANEIVVVLAINSSPYTVKLDANNGVDSRYYTGPFNVEYKKSTNNDIKLYEPYYDGYTFGGWYTANGIKVYDSDGKYVDDTGYWSSGLWQHIGNVTLYAQWTPNEYFVFFDENGGTCDVDEKTVTFNSPYGTLPFAQKNGYTFGGWYTALNGGDLVVDTTSVSIASNHTLYAHYDAITYSVNLDQQGATTLGTTSISPIFGNAMPSIILPQKQITVNFNGNGRGAVVNKPSITTDLVFNGYYSDRYSWNEQYYTESGTSARNWDISGNTTLYAYWSDAKIVLPGATRFGYTFAGWCLDSTCTEPVGGEGEEYWVLFPSTLYADWVASTSTVIFDANSDANDCTVSPQTKEVTFDLPYGKLADATRTGYIFSGWYEVPNPDLNVDEPVTEDDIVDFVGTKTLYAHWERAPVNLNINLLYTYDAGRAEHETFIDNYGYVVATFDVWINGELLPENTGVSEFNKFIGYGDSYEIRNIQTKPGYTGGLANVGYKKDGFTGQGLIGTLVGYDSENGLVYVWIDFKPNTYTITPVLNGGTAPNGSPQSYSVSFHQSWVSSVYVPSRVGYTFVEWQDLAGVKVFDVRGNNVNDGKYYYNGYWHYPGNLTVNAVWEANPYTVTFDKNATDAVCGTQDKVVVYDSAYGALPTPTRVGYTFEGWYTAADGGVRITDTTIVKTADDHTLYAKWEPIRVTVTFNPNGGVCAIRTKKVTFDSPYGTLPEPTKTGYTFVGWFTMANGGVQVFETTIMKAPADHTLHAHWVPNKYVITLDKNKGAGTSVVNLDFTSITVTFDSANHHYNNIDHNNYLANDLASRKGYTFQGYFTAAVDGIKVYNADGSVVNDGTYFNRGVYVYPYDATFYAQWIANTYNVVLNDRGATSMGHTTSVVMTYDSRGTSITVPTKTGYTFQGYYTGAYGTGTKYYSNTGACINTWTEDNVTELYAYWIQNTVVLPDEGDRTVPVPLPEIDYEGTIRSTDGKALLYADDYDASTGALTDRQPYLTYDTPSSTGAIPSTEQLAFRARFGAYMLGFKFHRYTGTDMVRIHVTVPYCTQYETADEELIISDVQTATYSFEIPKVWSYWAVEESGLFYPSKVTVTSSALLGGQVTVPVNNAITGAVSLPDYSLTKYPSKKDHVYWSSYDADGMPSLTIVLSDVEYIISDVFDTLPDVESHLSIICANAAWDDDRQAFAMSDSYSFGGKVILADDVCLDGNGKGVNEGNVPTGTGVVPQTIYEQTYLSGILMEPTVANGTHATSVTVTYVGDPSNVGTSAEKTESIKDVNALKVHTPVVCDGVIISGVVDDTLVLDDVMNFFALKVSNTGVHVLKLGYGEKDFLTALSGSSNVAKENGIHLNQISFPFDVYVDTDADSRRADGSVDSDGDYYVPAGTWLTVGTEEKTFYVAATVKAGEYTIDFRTIAVNCPKTGSSYNVSGNVQSDANTDMYKYVASDSVPLTIVSYVEDFAIVSTNDLSAKEELAADNQALVLKKGYKFAYRISSLGAFMGNAADVKIIPSYYHISSDGTQRTSATLYYSEVINGEKQNLVMAGDGADMANRHSFANDSESLGVPGSQLSKTQTLLRDSSFIGSTAGYFTYGYISLNKYARMFDGIDRTGLPMRYCNTCYRVYEYGESASCGHTSLRNTSLYSVYEKMTQDWYGEFALPMTSYVVTKDTKKGYCAVCDTHRYVTGGKRVGSCGHVLGNLVPFDFEDYMDINTVSGDEEFFRNDGYLVVHFDIMVRGDSGEWYEFSEWSDTDLYADFKDKPRYTEGDVIWYDLSKSSGDDYEVGGVE